MSEEAPSVAEELLLQSDNATRAELDRARFSLHMCSSNLCLEAASVLRGSSQSYASRQSKPGTHNAKWLAR